MIRPFAVLCVSLAALGAASAQTVEPLRPVLKASAIVTGDIVRVGDLIDNAGVIAKVPIFRAPDLGETGTVPADAVIDAVRVHALIGLDPGDVREVTVTRASRAIPAHEVELSIAQALSTQYALGDSGNIAVTFERELRAIQVEPNAKGEPRVARISYDARSGRFDASVEMPTGPSSRGLLRLTGRAAATVEVVTLVRAVERGALLKDSDLVVERRPRTEAGRDAITDPAQAAGLAARNALQPGKPLRNADLTKPELVQRGETVTLAYEMPGLMLTVRGKANEGGAEGDVISVLNEQTKRTLQGQVIAPGRVVVSIGSPRLAANLPPRAR